MKRILTVVVGTVGSALVIPSAFAYDFTMGPIEAATTTSITGGLGIRTKSASCSLVGDPNYCVGANTAQWANGDDGDLNYKKGQPYTASVSLVTEGLFKLPDSGLKLFVRGEGLYDFAAGHTSRTDLTGYAASQAVWQVQLLDFWGEKDFQIADQAAHVRLGNQVLNWGESVYATGGINVTNAYDIQKLLTPGTALKQALLPAPMISFASDLSHGFSTEAYYQFRWNSNQLPAVGTYWSQTDLLGRGSGPYSLNTSNANVGGLDAGSIAQSVGTKNVSGVTTGLVNGAYAGPPFNSLGIPFNTVLPYDNNQYGFRLNWAPKNTQLNLSAYYIEYTDKTPNETSLANGTGQWSYLTKRQLLGVSANFPVSDWAVGWELSYRPRDAVTMSGCFGPGGPADSNTNAVSGVNCPLYKDYKRFQMTLNGILSLTPSQYPFLKLIGANSALLTAEASWIYYPGLTSNAPVYRTINGVPVMQLPDAGLYSWLKNGSQGYPIVTGQGTASSVGITLDFNWTYDGSLIPGWQVTPGVTFTDAVYGYTPNLNANYEHGAKSINAYIVLTQNPAKWAAGINFAAFFGGNALSQPFSDRNYVGAYLTRTF